jgi:hypothetical protein
MPHISVRQTNPQKNVSSAGPILKLDPIAKEKCNHNIRTGHVAVQVSNTEYKYVMNLSGTLNKKEKKRGEEGGRRTMPSS